MQVFKEKSQENILGYFYCIYVLTTEGSHNQVNPIVVPDNML